MLPPITRFKRVALDILFPPYCLGCGREGDYICAACRAGLPRIVPPACPRCGRPLDSNGVCPGCIEPDAAVDSIAAPFLFTGVIRRAVHELKYRNLRAAVPLLAAFMADFLRDNPLPADVLVPVPVHPRRERERGFNQAALLCRELGRLTGLPVIDNCLGRTAYNPAQARALTEAERRRNVAGAFACKDDRLRGRQVLLVDDVSTSGATLSAAAAALKAAGALSVRGLTLALEL